MNEAGPNASSLAAAGTLAGSNLSGTLDADLRNSRVLIVDDSKFNRQILARFVGWAGVSQIEFAVDGVEGLEKVKSFQPDLILVDFAMPRMGGIELTQALRKEPEYADLPILLQTTLNSDQQRVACFKAGATDILSMPINPGECIARVRLHLEKLILFREMRKFRERVESELKLARAMQAALIPDARKINALIEPRHLQMEALFEPSSELGGDFWNIFEYSDTAIGVINVDFSGHGINAAINTFRLHTIIERTPVKGRMPGEWLAEINSALKDVLPMGQFATAFYGIFDTATDMLTYAGSGAPSPIMGNPDGSLELLDTSGLFLGVSKRTTYEDRTHPFPKGSFLLTYSDALIEETVPGVEALGEEGLLALTERILASNPAKPMKALTDSFFASYAHPPLTDDLTCLWISRPS
jgi:sigma-B regulation protein RsbU (phosphoserine phosphatase)